VEIDERVKRCGMQSMRLPRWLKPARNDGGVMCRLKRRKKNDYITMTNIFTFSVTARNEVTKQSHTIMPAELKNINICQSMKILLFTNFNGIIKIN